MRSQRPAIWVCLLLASTAGCRRATPSQRESDLPAIVVAEPVRIGSIRGVVSATAVVEALPGSDFAAIATQPGRILEISKNIGDPVKAGEVLVRFEFPSARAEGTARAAAVSAAELRVQNTRTIQARIHKLQDAGAASQREVDEADHAVVEAETEVAEARAAQRAAESAGQHTAIVAPFNGKVVERLHNPGDMVTNAETDVILRVIDPRQVEVVASVPVTEATRFGIGASARGVADVKGMPEVLRVTARPGPEPGASTIPVRLAFVQPTPLEPGVQLGVEIDAEQRSNVLLVPTVALVKDGDSAVVFVAAGDQSRKRAVATGLADAERTEIVSGLKAGDMVITQGQSNLRDGSAITVGQ